MNFAFCNVNSISLPNLRYYAAQSLQLSLSAYYLVCLRLKKIVTYIPQRLTTSGWLNLSRRASHPLYDTTLLGRTGKLHAYLYEIDTLVHQRVEEIVPAMAKRNGTNEELKARDQMEWVGRMNNYRHCAEEVVFKEIIYV